jgi:hypothetical protein
MPESDLPADRREELIEEITARVADPSRPD